MKLQTVEYQLSPDGPTYRGAAVVDKEFNGKIAAIFGDGYQIYFKWFTANLINGPLAYLDTKY